VRPKQLATALVLSLSLTACALASEPVPSAPAPRGLRQRMTMQDFQAPRRLRAFSGGTNSNWWRSRGTPPDNSTIPTPINRNPKGRPYSPFPNFPKSI
jgi:hypothetical protein